MVGKSNEVIIAGGLSQTNQRHIPTEILSLFSMSWKSGTMLPNEVSYPSIASYKETVLISGGDWRGEKGEIFQVICI